MTKNVFFGRQQYVGILEKRIRDFKNGYRQNMAIIGDKLVGKTSIIFQFLQRFCDSRVVPLYLEIRREPFASFARRFIGILLYDFMTGEGAPLKEDLDFLIEKSSKHIPKTVEKIRAVLDAIDHRKKNDIFTQLLALCDSFHQETGKSCVVIWDEFHNLQDFEIKNLYSEWCKSLIVQKNTMHIIISSNKSRAKAILAKNLSLLFGNFEVINVEPFDIKTSEEYLEYRLCGMNIDKGIKNFIVHFTGGYPFYLGLISDLLLKPNYADVVDLLENLLFTPSGILNVKFTDYLKYFLESNHSQDYISILHSISNGHNKIKDIAHILHKPKKELVLRVNHLLESDVITRTGDFLKINDRVFGFWLKFVYQGKAQSLTFDAKNQKNVFRKNIALALQEFLTQAERPYRERIAELLHMFADETIQIESKRLKLNRFREIKNLEFNNRTIKEGIIGRSNDSLWIMAVKRDFVTEEDVANFTQECKKYRHKLQRKIIVAFQDIDANARLRALEEKIWTWNVNNVNQMLDIFSKPRIIA